MTASDQDTDASNLLQTVKKQQLVDLCEQMGMSAKGTKEELLQRLRQRATTQAEAERNRRLERVRELEEGSADPKERHEIVASPWEDEEDEDDFFYYFAPEEVNATTTSKSSTSGKKKKPGYISQASVTAPPPPLEPNEQGERVVTVYSTTEQNDLTGIAASQPGQTAFSSDALTTSAPSSSSSQPWEPQNNQRATTSKEEETAKEEIIELVQTLLSMTGLPAFYFGEEVLDNIPAFAPPQTFVGFQPGKVPTEILATSSQALRTGRGSILQDVLRQFELQGIGQDGMWGDNTEKGGGHYREVSKVRAFLEGYRRAEVRQIARETTAMLLDSLVSEGVEGLDTTLATMTRSSDDTSKYGGELNDSLLEYLNDAIRQQEMKVDQLVAQRLKSSDRKELFGATQSNDALDALWNVTTTEDGQRLESLDPKDPKVMAALEEELTREEISESLSREREDIPDSATEKLLLLLRLLRERIKAEAVFSPDEKGRNLRLLAYCLQLSSDKERRLLLQKDVGNSIDVRICRDFDSSISPLTSVLFLQRLDSFIELVSSSVEYGESASYQLQPAKTKRPMNLREHRRILLLAEDFHKEQKIKATGVR
jgi:hypothetical protein